MTDDTLLLKAIAVWEEIWNAVCSPEIYTAEENFHAAEIIQKALIKHTTSSTNPIAQQGKLDHHMENPNTKGVPTMSTANHEEGAHYLCADGTIGIFTLGEFIGAQEEKLPTSSVLRKINYPNDGVFTPANRYAVTKSRDLIYLDSSLFGSNGIHYTSMGYAIHQSSGHDILTILNADWNSYTYLPTSTDQPILLRCYSHYRGYYYRVAYCVHRFPNSPKWYTAPGEAVPNADIISWMRIPGARDEEFGVSREWREKTNAKGGRELWEGEGE